MSSCRLAPFQLRNMIAPHLLYIPADPNVFLCRVLVLLRSGGGVRLRTMVLPLLGGVDGLELVCGVLGLGWLWVELCR